MTDRDITPAVRDEMRRAAEAATPGQWRAEEPYAACDPNDIATLYDSKYIENRNAENDAAHIAASNPANVLALLDENDGLRAALTTAEARAERAEREKNEARSIGLMINNAFAEDAGKEADILANLLRAANSEIAYQRDRAETAEASLAAERECTREMGAALERVIEIAGRNEASPDIERARRVLAAYRAGQAGGEGADG